MLWKKEEMLMDSNIAAYANKFRTGGLGNLLEEVYFGYKANSEQEADFPQAGVELKTTPYEYTKRVVSAFNGKENIVEDEFSKIKENLDKVVKEIDAQLYTVIKKYISNRVRHKNFSNS